MKPVAVITGAANNIGLAIANQFSQHYQVVGLDRAFEKQEQNSINACLLYTSPSPRDRTRSRMPSSA